jgi:hemerythrin superfamily protein
MNAHELIKKQHRDVERAYDEFISVSGERREELAKQILTDLTVHAGIEEEIYYPELRTISEVELADEYTAEHQAMKGLIMKLTAMNADNEKYESSMKALMDLVAHHVEEEESVGMPKVEDAVDAHHLDIIGEKMQKRTKELKESTLKRLWAAVT